jgi:hypothetical protein
LLRLSLFSTQVASRKNGLNTNDRKGLGDYSISQRAGFFRPRVQLSQRHMPFPYRCPTDSRYVVELIQFVLFESGHMSSAYNRHACTVAISLKVHSHRRSIDKVASGSLGKGGISRCWLSTISQHMQHTCVYRFGSGSISTLHIWPVDDLFRLTEAPIPSLRLPGTDLFPSQVIICSMRLIPEADVTVRMEACSCYFPISFHRRALRKLRPQNEI